MKRNLTRDLAVGALVLAAALIFTLAVFMIGSEQRVWVRKTEFRLKVPDANGLNAGSPVRLAGVQVGTITDISFPTDPSEVTIEVKLAVDNAHLHRLRQNTVADIKILTLLAGEKYIELTPGDPNLPALPPGAYINVPGSFGMAQLGELSAGLAGDIQSISTNIRVILETVLKREGVVGRLLLDPEFGKAAATDIARSASLLRTTMENINSGKGLAGRLLSDDEYGRQTVASLKTSLERVESLLTEATKDGGMADQLFDPNGKLASSIDNLSSATADLKEFTTSLKADQGTVGRLLSDEKYAAEVLENIRKISADLAAVTGKLKEGDGTLGAAINDPQLYQDLKDVVRGVQNSKVLGGLIRHYRKKGEEQRLKDGTRQPNRPKDGDGQQAPPAPEGGY